MRYQPSSLGSFWVSADGYELQMKGNSQNSRSYANFEAVAAFALLARALASALDSALALALGLALWPISAEPTTKINQNKAEPMQRRQRRLRQRCSRHTPRQARPGRGPKSTRRCCRCCCRCCYHRCCCCRFTASKFRRRRRWHRFSLSLAALLCSAPFALARRPLDWRCSVSQVQTVDVYGLWSGSAHIVTRVSEKLSRLQSGQEQQQ